jgi:hypothetical protein
VRKYRANHQREENSSTTRNPLKRLVIQLGAHIQKPKITRVAARKLR